MLSGNLFESWPNRRHDRQSLRRRTARSTILVGGSGCALLRRRNRFDDVGNLGNPGNRRNLFRQGFEEAADIALTIVGEPRALMPVYLPDLPKPVTPKIELSEGERRWAPHLRAWRKTDLGFSEFCHQEGLDPDAMRKALAKHLKRAKQRVEEQRQ